CSCLFFFFQAEDGIRDRNVTGVQTCALPIYGLPNVLREAMAVGTPVVASRVAGIPEALDDGRCGVLVPPADVAALTDAIAGMLADEDRRRQFAARGRRRTEELFDAWRNGSRLADHLRAMRRMRGAEAALRC